MHSSRARAPLRIGLAGGGSDLKEYYEKYNGAVISVTIRKYAYAELKNNDDYFKAESLDLSKEYIIKDIHSLDLSIVPKQLLLHIYVYKRIIREFNNNQQINCHLSTYSDSPIGSGLGSSSTLVVAMVKCFNESLNLALDDYRIAHLSYEIERIDCGFSGGKQDQYSAVFGGFNFIEFNPYNTIVNPLRIKDWFRFELECSLILHFTGVSRYSSDVISDQAEVINQSNKNLVYLHKLKKQAYIMKEAVLKCDINSFKDSLNSTWYFKSKTSSKITNEFINKRIELGYKYGAEAAKVSGAGGGGFILFMCNSANAIQLKNRLRLENDETFFCSFCDNGAESWRLL